MEKEVGDNLLSHNDLQKYLTAFETSFDGIAVIDRDKRILYSNCANANTYGYASKHELIGMKWPVLCADREAKRFEDEIVPLAWKNGRWRGKSVGKRRDGSKFYHEISLAIIEGWRFVVVVRDLTEHKKAIDSLFR